MNTIQAENLLKKAIGSAGSPKNKMIASGVCHDIRLFAREVTGSVSDKELEKWVVDVASDYVHDMDRLVKETAEALKIEAKSLVIVVRQVPALVNMRKPDGERCWRFHARCGTRVEPYPKADPRSSARIAIERAKIAEQEQETKKRSEILEDTL